MEEAKELIKVSAPDLLSDEPSKQKNALTDFVHTAVYGATAAPLRGLAQIADHHAGTKIDESIKAGFDNLGVTQPAAAEFNSSNWYAQQLGGAVGMTLPFLLVRGGVKAGASQVFGETAIKSALDTGVSHSMLRFATQEAAISGVAGFAYGSLLNPSNEKLVGSSDFYKDRFSHGATDAAVFSTLGFTAPYIAKPLATAAGMVERSATVPLVKDAISMTLRGPVLPGALSGLPAGAVAAEAIALKDGRLVPTGQELKENLVGMAVVGGTLGTAHWLGAQRAGTNMTNARYLTDKVGLTEASNSFKAEFKIVEGKQQLNQLHQDILAGAENAQAQLIVKPRLETALSGISGKASSTYGDARPMLIDHRSAGMLSVNNARSVGLIGTCSVLDPVLGTRDVFQGRSEAASAANRKVWLTPLGSENFSLRTGPQIENRTNAPNPFAAPERAAVALGSEVEEGRLRAPRRWTGPSEEVRMEPLNLFGAELENGESRLLFFNRDGHTRNRADATTGVNIGLDKTGWPYISATTGRELWRLNGAELPEGITYLDAKGHDRLTFADRVDFELSRKNYGEGNVLRLKYNVNEGRGPAAPTGTESTPPAEFRDRDRGRDGDYRDRDRGRDGEYRDRDRGRDGDSRDRDRGPRDRGDSRDRTPPDYVPGKYETPRPRSNFEIGEGVFRVLGKMLAKPGDQTLVAMNKDGTRGNLVKNDSVARFGVDAGKNPFIQINYGSELWSFNGQPMEAKRQYPITEKDTLVFNGHTNFSLSNKVTPHGQTALDIALVPPPVDPARRGIDMTSIATPARIETLMEKYHEDAAAKAIEREAALSAEPKPELTGAEKPVEPENSATATGEKLPEAVPTEVDRSPGSEKPIEAGRPVEAERQVDPSAETVEPNRTNSPTPAETNTGIENSTPVESNGSVVDNPAPVPEPAPRKPADPLDLLKSPLDQILEPFALTDEAAANRNRIASPEPAEAKSLSRPLEAHDRISINGKELAIGTEFKIGKFPGINIQIGGKDSSVAKMHGYVGRNAEGKLYVKDSKSSSGIFVNGKQIPKEQMFEISSGDQVVVGSNKTQVLSLKMLEQQR